MKVFSAMFAVILVAAIAYGQQAEDFGSTDSQPALGTPMYKQTVLFVFVDRTKSSRLCRALRHAGYEVAGTSSSLQAIALLFVIRSVAAVVVDQRTEEHASFDLARNLRAVRPHVPIILLCREQIPHLPACTDACVSGEEPVDSLLSALNAIVSRPKAAAS